MRGEDYTISRENDGEVRGSCPRITAVIQKLEETVMEGARGGARR